jgi:hypothetical protein
MQVLAGLADIVKIKNGHKFTFLKMVKESRLIYDLRLSLKAYGREAGRL